MSENENPFVEYFGHNGVMVGGLSLSRGFFFTFVSILLTALQKKSDILA
jgi:hypothetical protein